MTTRRDILTGGAGLAAILASGKAPAALVRSMVAMRNAMMTGKRLPYDAEVEYLEADNGNLTQGSIPRCILDTGIVPDIDADVWECDAQFVAFSTAAGCWGATGNRFAFGRGSASWNDWYYGFGDANNRTGETWDYARHTFRLDAPARKFSVGANTYSGSGSVVSGYDVTVAIFSRNTHNGLQYLQDNCKSRMYSSKYYRHGVLIQHLIPVIDTQGAACAFDKVSGELFHNAGTGAFVAGPDK